jgi:hypothetical protein
MHMRIQLRQRPLYAVAEFVPPDTSHFPAGNVVNGLRSVCRCTGDRLMPGRQQFNLEETVVRFVENPEDFCELRRPLFGHVAWLELWSCGGRCG